MKTVVERVSKLMCISVVFVWFTSQFGGGWASGMQALAWFAQHGWMSLWMPLVGMAIIGGISYLAIEVARVSRSYHYRSFIDTLYKRKWATNLYEIIMLIGSCITAGALIATAGGLGQSLGLNYWVSVLIFSAMVVLGCIFGEKIVRRSATVMGVVIVALVVVVFIAVVGARSENVNRMVSEGVVYTSWGDAWYNGIRFGAITCPMMVSLLPVTTKVSNKKESLFISIAGFLVNSFIIFCLCYIMLSFMPDIGMSGVPLMYAMQNLGIPGLEAAYAIILLLALLTTGIGMLYTYVVRFEPKLKFGTEKIRGSVIILAILGVSAAISAAGLYAIIAKGYSFMAYTNLPYILIGLPIAGIPILRKAYKKEKESAACEMEREEST